MKAIGIWEKCDGVLTFYIEVNFLFIYDNINVLNDKLCHKADGSNPSLKQFCRSLFNFFLKSKKLQPIFNLKQFPREPRIQLAPLFLLDLQSFIQANVISLKLFSFWK